MLADLKGPPANPSSVHSFGAEARSLLISARKTLADFLHARPEEITFTSGGTESLNLLLRGLKGHIITTKLEHSAIHETLKSLDLDITYLPTGLFGVPTSSQIESAIRPDTKGVLLSLSNGETGVKIDLDAIAQIAEKRNIPLLIDAVSAIGKEPLNLPKGVSALALSAHKFHGPKGVGALLLRSPLKLSPLFTGGAQESKLRAGTENLAGILGLAKAIQILKEEQLSITEHLLSLRTLFEKGLSNSLPDIAINGEGPRVSNTSNIAFLGVDGESLLLHLDLNNIAASHGSACASGSLEPSRVLLEMGIDRKRARSSIRFSFSRMNTTHEIDQAVLIISSIVKKLRNYLKITCTIPRPL
jgi:cysteine desulfurase